MPDLAATSVAFGARCRTHRIECFVGGSLHNVWALVLEARVTLDDYEPPVVEEVEPAGLADGRWHRGAADVTFSASDNTAVMERRLVEGTSVRAVQAAPGASAGGCYGGTGIAYTYTQPCAGERGVNGRRSFSVNPCSWGDGVHQIRAVAVDTDRAEASTAPFAVKVDCGAPVVSLEVGAPTREAGVPLDPAVKASDAASGVAGTALEVSTSGGAWTAAPSTVTAVAGRSYRFRARATDVAGNSSVWTYSPVVQGVAAPTAAPPPPPAPVVVAGSPYDPAPVPPQQLPALPRQDSPAPVDPPTRAVAAEPPAALVPQLPKVLPQKDVRLRIVKVRRKGRSLAVSGTVAPGFAQRVSVRVGRTPARRVRARAGRWSVKVHVAAAKTSVVVTTPTTAAFAPGSARVVA